MMCQAGGGVHGDRLRGLITVLWRAGLRIAEALDLHEGDLEPARGAMLVREGKGGRRRGGRHGRLGLGATAAMARSARRDAGRAALLCDRRTYTRQAWTAPAVRIQLRRLAAAAGVRRRFAPHQLRHAHAVEMAREGCRST